MTEIKKHPSNKDYRERFEFVLSVDNNIICQRYFKINRFKPESLESYNLTDAARRCAAIIDNDLKSKTQAYVEIYAPQVFESEEEMYKAISENNGDNYYTRNLHDGQGIVVRGNNITDYSYIGNGQVKKIGFKFDDGELTDGEAEATKCTYKFAIKMDGRQITAVAWDGYYPKFVRNKIDIANKYGKFEGEDKNRLSFEEYILYKVMEGRGDLVFKLIRTIWDAIAIDNGGNPVTTDDEIMEAWRMTSDAISYRAI